MKNFDIVIGLEIHAELNTKSKVFCNCKNEFGAEPNTLVCPVCLGLPGALPTLNKKAVEYTIMGGLCFGCDINSLAVFERKNYFYPDLSKGYQLTQFESPICSHGGILLDNGKFIRFNRIHLEEDAGKLIHDGDKNESYIDFNRSGVPLLEMVTEPDLSSSEEVVEFITKLRATLISSGISDCHMEEGGLRFDINLSVREQGSKTLGTRVEMKNLNSFKSVAKAIDYEKVRQINEILSGREVAQETRGWNDAEERSFAMRAKENVNDYRYFPDPDLLKVKITREDIDRIRESMPELVDEKKLRYLSLGLSDYDASVLVSDKDISDYFDQVLEYTHEPKETANWVMTEIMRLQNETPQVTLSCLISPRELADIIELIVSQKITRVNAKILFDEVVNSGKTTEILIKELDLLGEVKDKDLVEIVKEIIKDNVKIAEDYLGEPEHVINFVIGSVMKNTNGKANIDKIKDVFEKEIKKYI